MHFINAINLIFLAPLLTHVVFAAPQAPNQATGQSKNANAPGATLAVLKTPIPVVPSLGELFSGSAPTSKPSAGPASPKFRLVRRNDFTYFRLDARQRTKTLAADLHMDLGYKQEALSTARSNLVQLEEDLSYAAQDGLTRRQVKKLRDEIDWLRESIPILRQDVRDYQRDMRNLIVKLESRLTYTRNNPMTAGQALDYCSPDQLIRLIGEVQVNLLEGDRVRRF